MSIKIHESLANTNTVKKIVGWAERNEAANYKKMQKYYPTAYMLLTVGVAQTGVIWASDDIPKKRRIPLALNNIINCAISLAGFLLITKHTDKLRDKFAQRAKEIFKGEKQEKMINGVKSGLPILVTALLYKYIGQVIATPITDKVNKYLVKKGVIDYSKDEKRDIYA